MYIKIMSDVVKCLIHKFCIFHFNFIFNDEEYHLYSLNKIEKIFNFKFYSDFLHEKFSYAFLLLCFTNDDEIYFIAQSDFNILQFSQHNADKKLFHTINNICILHNKNEICRV